ERFKTELENREIPTTFKTRVIRMDPTNFMSAPEIEEEPGYLLSKPLPIYYGELGFLQVVIPKPGNIILSQMAVILAVSIFLMVLMIVCFLIMLRTIIRQKKSSDMRTEFINNLTHELKTPIATVSAAVEAMQHFGALSSPERTEKYLNLSKEELKRLSRLVTKILDIASLDQRRVELHPERIQLGKLVRPIIEQYRMRKNKVVDIRFENALASEFVMADRLHLVNCINNLLDNAVKYSGDSVQIVVKASEENGHWKLSVQDNGFGIPKNKQEQIFDKFYRVPSSEVRNIKGFGLGLSYVKRIIELHDGKIFLESAPGLGSKFTMTMPQT
ncbi:MAG: HAMP domain-containing sensor histidine kinase, partial [Bacteroidota bacterium]